MKLLAALAIKLAVILLDFVNDQFKAHMQYIQLITGMYSWLPKFKKWSSIVHVGNLVWDTVTMSSLVIEG